MADSQTDTTESQPPLAPTKILFVCTGNICRSPLAEVMARSTFDGARFVFTSAGTYVVAGRPATEHAQAVARERGLDLTGHRAVSLDTCEEPDVVIGMEQHHLVAARRAFPGLDISRFRLLDHPVAIVDPYGCDIDAYVAAADHIERALAELPEDLTGRA
jgi:protein-tyrosine phosphatase